MVKDLKGTETEKNLQKALMGEALAYMKYTFYKKGLSEYSKTFEPLLDLIIHNEKEHAEIWFKQLHNGKIPDNIINLLDAISGEKEEHLVLYPEYSRVAKEEGFDEISDLFKEIAIIEGNHAKEYENLLKQVKDEKFYVGECYWKCLNCGHIHKSIDGKAPSECPVCKHPQKYFQRL